MKNQIRKWSRLAPPAVFVVLAAALTAGAEHHENWIEIKSPHFTAYSNGTEAEGRRVAYHFEEIRALFEQAFPSLRADSGDKPTFLYALKNEDSLRLFIPNYGQGKDPIKLAGIYLPARDANYALIRSDLTSLVTSASPAASPSLVRGIYQNKPSGQAVNPYHAIYHEYAHAVFRLNFRGMPAWLEEGLAEYWGNVEISGTQANLGLAETAQVRLLQQGPLLPIEQLLSIDRTSPLLNTQTHAGIFYAQSWALVHYLSMSPDVREQDLLTKFLVALQATDDPIEAASKTFGDLKQLGEKLNGYAGQLSFYGAQLKLNISISEKDLSARRLSPAEGMVRQADYLLHSNRLPEAIELLHQAAALDPNVPGLHDALGHYHYSKNDSENASKEFDLALAADPSDATVYYYRALILHRKSGYSAESTPLIRSNLEKMISLRPEFAPAHAFLCIAYINPPQMGSKAVQEALHATKLEPGNLAYFLDLGRALLADGKIDDARRVADRAQKSAATPQDRRMAESFTRELNAKTNPAAANSPATSTTAPPVEGAQPWEKENSLREVEGQITELICSHPPAVMLTLATPSEPILLQIKDITKIEIHDGSANAAASPTDCGKWRDRKAKVIFTPAPGGAAAGEVKSISFE